MPKELNISYQIKGSDKTKLIKLLIRKVENYFGTSIKSKGDAELLSLNMSRQKGILLSSNTIRRVFGLLPATKHSTSTLNKLSNYIGFKSFDEFASKEDMGNFILINTNSIFEPVDLIIHRFDKDDFSMTDIVYLSFITNQALKNKDITTINYIFSNSKIYELITSHEDLHDAFAQFVGPSVLNQEYINDPEMLLNLPFFQDLFLSKYVDTENEDLSTFYRCIVEKYPNSKYFNLAGSVLSLNYLYKKKFNKSRFYFSKINTQEKMSPELMGRVKLLMMIHECKGMNWLIEESENYLDELHLFSIDIVSYFSRTKNRAFIYKYYSKYRPYLFIHHKMISYELNRLYSTCYDIVQGKALSDDHINGCRLNSNATYSNIIHS